MRSWIVFVIAILAIVVGASLYYAYVTSHGTTSAHSSTTTSGHILRTSTLSYIVVKDAMGRTVKIHIPVKRIVSLYRFATSFLYMLGAKEKIVAEYVFGENFYKLVDPKIGEKLLHGRPSVETIVKLHPDLVIAATWMASRGYLKQLESLGIPVLFVKVESVKDIENTLLMLGKILNKESLAKKIVDYYNSVLDNVSAKLKQIRSKPRVLVIYYSAKHHSFRTFGGDMFQCRLVELAGGVCVSHSLTGKKSINDEQIIKWNPDVIVVIRYFGPPAEQIKELILHDKALRFVNAVKNGRVYVVPNDGENWIDPNPKWILGYLWLAKVLHPKLFQNLNITKFAASFYREFFNVSIGTVKIVGDVSG